MFRKHPKAPHVNLRSKFQVEMVSSNKKITSGVRDLFEIVDLLNQHSSSIIIEQDVLFMRPEQFEEFKSDRSLTNESIRLDQTICE